MAADSASSSASPSLSVVESTSAARRLEAASRFVRQYPPGTEILIVGASRQAADDFVRELAVPRGADPAQQPRATFGLRRFSLLQLAAFIASPELARRQLAPASRVGVEAMTTRAAFDARRDRVLAHLAPIADRPGFPAALAETMADLRGAGIAAAALPARDPCLADLASLLARFETQLEAFGIADVPTLFRVAGGALAERRAVPIQPSPLLLLDVAVESQSVAEFLTALVQFAAASLVTLPAHDSRARQWVARLSEPSTRSESVATTEGALHRVQERLFQFDVEIESTVGDLDTAAQVDFFSAPGEGREAVEIARRVLLEAQTGTPFDRIAVLMRAPQLYGALLETAFRRARIPAWFARGGRRPDPSGRAFLALLACALERLSARRFAEYLSLGEVPDAAAADLPSQRRWVPPGDELLREPAPIADGGQQAAFDFGEWSPETGKDEADDERAVVAGTLRAPWRWEDLLVEAAVIGSRDRWGRRLAGLERDLELKLHEIESEDPDSPKAASVKRDLRNLGHLRDFALPVIGRLAAFPSAATWGDWLEHLATLAPAVLRRPERVLAVLAELQPMSEVGPVALEEVHRVLAEHLSQLHKEPPPHRYGAVLVATPEQARGRVFDVVFVPGLAERVFPQRAREDPLLVDERRRQLSSHLALREDIAQKERQMLRLAVGAASRRLCLSYPSMDLTQARARVPSFYALDVERARTGRVPDFEVLADRAQRSGGARLAWPAPAEPGRAIDDSERDLAILAHLLALQQKDRVGARGRARFLLGLNPHLARAMRSRWLRADRRWSAADGFYNAGPDARACLSAHRLRARPYSVSALQRFATCPYQFLLGAIHRLEPRSDMTWLEQMDPLQRGEIFHRVQAEVVRLLVDDRGRWRGATHTQAMDALNRRLEAVAAEYYDDLAPAIDRVWQSEIESMRTDLRGWLERLLDDAGQWQPQHAEFGFGFAASEGRDPASIAAPVTLPGGWQLHGYVDLIERRAGGETLRVTDHKTGRVRADERVVVGGGETLQPVLYGMAIEMALSRPVEAGRLFYCTLAGRYEERVVTLDAQARRSAAEVLEIIDRAVEQASLPPAPREGACRYCDFRAVCGPDEERRIARKDQRPLADLHYLRGLR